MPGLVGIKKINIAVFISGNGSNLKNLIIHSLKMANINYISNNSDK